eukprot:RCo027569
MLLRVILFLSGSRQEELQVQILPDSSILDLRNQVKTLCSGLLGGSDITLIAKGRTLMDCCTLNEYHITGADTVFGLPVPPIPSQGGSRPTQDVQFSSSSAGVSPG